MSSPMSVLSRTLQSISLSKIRELDSRRNSYEARKQAFINKAHGSPDRRDRLGSLLDGCRELASPNALADHSLDNIQRWLAQSKYDASIPESKLANFDRQLHSKLDVQSRRLDMAHLYSRLLTEWMEQAAPETSSHPVAESQRRRLKDLVNKFESVVFEPLETGEHEIRGFLDGLFPDAKSQETLQQLRDRISNQTASLMNETRPFNQASLTSCIKGLLTEDLVSDEKRAILQNFLESDVAKDEIADVLNMRFADLKRWQWNAGELGIPVMPRAGLNGKYRIWADDDILQMIFVQYIGVKLSTIMKSLLKQFMEKVWTRDMDGHAFPSARDRDRRRYYLDQHWVEGQGVEPERAMNYLETFFLSSLPSSETSLFEGGQQYDNEMDETDDDEDDDEDWAYSREVKLPKQKTNIRQQLLRQLTAEMFIHRLRGVTHQSPKDARGPVALIQTDIQWFGTSIPHSTAFAVMRYFGFQEEWIDFFRKYLEAPLNLDMASDDRPQHGPRTRKRGVPMAHASEKLIGEMLLFCMDLAVHRQTGVLLYRIHDDIWLCGEPETTARAWACMQDYGKIFGLEFNRSKTGSVYLPGNSTVSPDAEDDSQIMQRLPAGTVSVGFLVLDSASGKWQIDQGRVSAHLDQLEKQLGECKSVLAWVQTWNSCIGRFFTNVLGEPAHCLGVEHVDAMLDTYSRMLKRLLPPPANGNVTAHVKSMISSHLDLPDESATIPDAFVHLPETLGGLGLRNPFVPLLLVRDQLSDSPDKILEKYLADEYAEYLDYKKLFDESPSWKLRSRLRDIMPDDSESESEDDDESDTASNGSSSSSDESDRNSSAPTPSATTSKETTTNPIIRPRETYKFFFPLEFARFRERFSLNLRNIYTDTLLSTPRGKGIALDKRTLDALDDALLSSGKHGVVHPERSSHIRRRGHYRGRGGRGGGYSSGNNGGIRKATSGGKNAPPLTPENKWFVALYAEELLETYGALSLVDKQFLPGGVLSMMRQKKVTWQMML